MDGKLIFWTLALADTGLPKREIAEIRSGSKEENAATMRRLFQGELGPVRDFVVINSAATLLAAEAVASLDEGITKAKEVIDSGAAMAKLEALAELSQRLSRGCE